MATAADLRAILPVSSTPSGSQQRQTHTQTNKRPEGISRELYNLIGNSVPSLAAQLNKKPRLKQKPNLQGRDTGTKWLVHLSPNLLDGMLMQLVYDDRQWRPFRNGARSDNLRLGHWTKATTDPEQDYPFSRYNASSSTYSYTDDEYTRLLTDPDWTKEETDHFFALLKDFGTRWYILHDRYEFPGKTRSIEDLKDRYCVVCRKLIKDRPWEGDEASRTALLATFQFDKEREINRKTYVAGLETRTPEQLAEEEALYIEIKRLEQSERQFRKERDNLLRTLAGIESGLPDVLDDDSPWTANSAMGANGGAGGAAGGGNLPPVETTTKKKKKGVRDAMDVDSPITPSTISLPPAPVTIPLVKRASEKQTAQDIANCIYRTDPPPPGASYKSSHHPAHLRSFRLPQPKGASAPRVTQAFSELGVNSSRLVIYTRENIAHFDALLESVGVLLDLKKMVDKVEQDVRVAKGRLGIRESVGVEDAAGAANGGGGGGGKGAGGAGGAMDVDGDEGDGDGEPDEDGRAQSVMSARSTRSRKQSRRSSVSSVDASSARGTVKRQKKT